MSDPWLIATVGTFFSSVVLGSYQAIVGARQRKSADAIAIRQQQLEEQDSELNEFDKIVAAQRSYINLLEERDGKLETIVSELRKDNEALRLAHGGCEVTKRQLNEDLEALRRRMDQK